MYKIAIIVLADSESHADLARVANALVAAKEFKDSGDSVQVIFDGAATKWIAELSKEDHRLHGLYESLKDCVKGACGFCANAFDVAQLVQECHVKLMNEHAGHPSFRKLISEDYTILTF